MTDGALRITGPFAIRSDDLAEHLLEAEHAEIPPETVAAIAAAIGYPVVLKVVSPQITHKTDVGGVALNLANDEQVRRAYEEMIAAVRRARPDAEIQGVSVQPMVSLPGGIELIIGTKKDPVFGPVIMVGFGGIAAELCAVSQQECWSALKSPVRRVTGQDTTIPCALSLEAAWLPSVTEKKTPWAMQPGSSRREAGKPHSVNGPLRLGRLILL
jgi:hypothetical protein